MSNRWITLIAAFPLIAASATQPAPPFTISPETTSALGPVRPDGSVDYVAAVNQRFSQGVTPDNNGFVLWLGVMGIDDFPQSVRQQVLTMCGAENLKAGSIWTNFDRNTPEDGRGLHLWNASENPAYAEFLKSHEDLLADATQAAARPRWWAPSVSTNGALFGVLLPQLRNMRDVSQALCNRALLRAQQGDLDGFLSDVITAKRLGRRAAGFYLIGDLVAIRINDTADHAIGAAAGAGILSGDRCRKLAAALDELQPSSQPWESVDVGERWGSLEFAQTIATGNLQRLIQGDDNFTRQLKPFDSIDRDAVDWNTALRQINGTYDQMVRIMKMPPGRDAQLARREFDREMATRRANLAPLKALTKWPADAPPAYTQRVTNAIVSVLMPSLWRIQDQFRSCAMEDQMARAVLAAAQYRADNGDWPDTLQTLTPKYLLAPPKDIFLGDGMNVVRYEKTQRGVCLRARGLDGTDIIVGAR